MKAGPHPPVGGDLSESALTRCRVVRQEKGGYTLDRPQGEVTATLSGRFRHGVKSPADYPAVGDYVLADFSGGSAVICRLLPRRSVFMRRSAGKKAVEQVVAANVDTVFLCMALDGDFNLRRLERYLAAGWDSGAVPVVVLTKKDLAEDLPGQMAAAQAVAAGAQVVALSARDDAEIAALDPYLTPGQTVAFLGSSGVGKSTLINRLLGEDLQAVGGLSLDGRGRHTTTRRSLVALPGGAFVMDTPGMRELGLWDAEAGLEHTFGDIEALSAACRFRDCTHRGEPGCAVQAAVLRGALGEQRLASYRKLQAEQRYDRDAAGYLAEKREKFKKIARAIRDAGGKR